MIFQTFQTLADVKNSTTDLSQLLIYTNDITGGSAMPIVLFAFFVISFLGSAFLNVRFRGVFRFDFCFAAAGFTTFGLACIMSLKNGLLNPFYLILSIIVAVIGVAILYLSSND